MNLKIDLDITNPEYVGIAALSVFVLVVSHSTFIKNYLFETKKSKINDAMKKKWNIYTKDSISDLSDLGEVWERENRNEDSASDAVYSGDSVYEEGGYTSDEYCDEEQELKKLENECMIESDEEWEVNGCLKFIKENKPNKVYEYVKGFGTTVAIYGTTKKNRHWVYSKLGAKLHAKSITGSDGKKVLLLTDIELLNGLQSSLLGGDVIAYDVDDEKAVVQSEC